MPSNDSKQPPAWPDGKAPATLHEFYRCLEVSRACTAEEARQFIANLPEGKRPDAPKAVAIELIKALKLTKFQAQAVLQGKIKYLNFGEYVVLDRLGRGGMGEVLKAEHRRMQRTVALKVISGSAMKDADAVKRFQREVHAAARLIHPNIVTAFDANEHHGVHFLVMEFVEGRDLAAVLHAQGPLPVATAIDYVLQAARGLTYAHGKGIVHRDIKPGNLLVDRDGTVKILDMGLARIDLGAGSSLELTSTGQVMGTVDYMAPEQAEDTHSADARADIYSLGCTLYRLLSGEVLYGGESVVKKLLAHRSSPIPPLSAVCTSAPEALDATFRKMVAKRPEDRQQSMTQVVTELEKVLRALTAVAPDAGPTEPTVDLKLSEFLAGIGSRTGKSSPTATAPKSATKFAAATEVTQDLAAGDTTTTGLVGLGSAAVAKAEPAAKATLPKKRSSWLARHPIASLIAAALGGLALAAAGIVVFLPTSDGTIRVEINDPSIEVTVSGSGYKIKGKTEEIHVKPGEHTLHVKTGELEFDTNKFALGKGPNPAVKVELLPGKVQVVRGDGRLLGEKPWIAPPGADHDRIAASALHSRATLVLRLASGTVETVKPREALPTVPFSVQGVDFLGSPELPADFTESVLLPAVIPLSKCEAIGDGTARLAWTDDDVVRLVASPVAVALRNIECPSLTLTKANVESLSKLRKLEGLRATVVQIDDELWSGLKSLAPLQRLRLEGIPKSTPLGAAAAAGLSAHPLKSLVVSGTWSLELTRALSRLAKLEEVAVLNGVISPEALRELVSCPNLNVLYCNGTELADGHLAVIGQMKQLRYLTVVSGNVPEPAVRKLATQLPACRIHWDGGVIEPTAPNSTAGASSVAKSGEWIDLFNGRDLYGWLQKGHAGWSVKDGVLTGESVGAVGWLMSSREFGDFELDLEYRLPPGGNSGVFLRAPDSGNISGSEFHEVQLLDDPAPKFANVDPKGRNGALFSKIAPTKAPIKPANVWRPLRIRVAGQRLQVALDGTEVLDSDLPTGKPNRGHIGLQLYNPGISFRGIRVRELNADGSVKGVAAAAVSQGRNFALSFDGVDDYVEIPTLNYDGSHPLTIEAYAKPSEAREMAVMHIFGTGWMALASGKQGSWGTLVAAGEQHFMTFAGGPFQTSQATHVAAVWDQKELRLYVNGRLRPGTVPAKPQAHKGTTTIGAGYGGVRMFHFAGEIDEVRVSKVARYDRDFTPAKRHAPDDQTLALYHCNEGQGDVVTDSSGNGHHGKIVGAKWVRAAEPNTETSGSMAPAETNLLANRIVDECVARNPANFTRDPAGLIISQDTVVVRDWNPGETSIRAQVRSLKGVGGAAGNPRFALLMGDSDKSTLGAYFTGTQWHVQFTSDWMDLSKFKDLGGGDAPVREMGEREIEFRHNNRTVTVLDGGQVVVVVPNIDFQPSNTAIYVPPGSQVLVKSWTSRKPDAATRDATQRIIDLLPLVDLKRDVVSGQWRRVPEGLVAEGNAPETDRGKRLQLPYTPPEEYDFEIEVTPAAANFRTTQHFWAAGRSITWEYDSKPAGQAQYISGFSRLDGMQAQQSPESMKRDASLLTPGGRNRSRIEVRRDSLRVLLNDALIATWQGDLKRFSDSDLRDELPDPQRLGVVTFQNTATFHKITVREVTGRGTFAPGVTPAIEP